MFRLGEGSIHPWVGGRQALLGRRETKTKLKLELLEKFSSTPYVAAPTTSANVMRRFLSSVGKSESVYVIFTAVSRGGRLVKVVRSYLVVSMHTGKDFLI